MGFQESGEPKMKIGIDLGGSHIAIGVVDNRGKILEKVEKRITKAEKNTIKKVIEDYIIEKTMNFLQQYKITEMGIAIPGTVKNDIVVKWVNLGLKNYEIVKNLQEKIKLPIKIRNDAKCAALAENAYGALNRSNVNDELNSMEPDDRADAVTTGTTSEISDAQDARQSYLDSMQ